jgi:molecular chaperone Hsp33
MGGQPYHGTVQLQTSEIGDDLAFYLTDSEQIPSAVGLTASIDAQGAISGCGGFLVQALPGTTEEQINAVMAAIAGIASVGELLAQGGAELLIEKLFAGDSYALLERTELQFRCSCDEHKVMRVLATLPKEEIALMIAEKQATEVSCEFCRQRYVIEPENLEALLADINAAVRTVEDA